MFNIYLDGTVEFNNDHHMWTKLFIYQITIEPTPFIYFIDIFIYLIIFKFELCHYTGVHSSTLTKMKRVVAWK